MILDGVCYPVVHFGMAILYEWNGPPVVSLFLASTLFYLRVLSFHATNNTSFIVFSRLSALPSGEGVLIH